MQTSLYNTIIVGSCRTVNRQTCLFPENPSPALSLRPVRPGGFSPERKMATPKVLILRAPGTNCDEEAQHAFELAGAPAERVHINRLRDDPALLHHYQILMLPGGFSYGDDVGAGKILANQLTAFLGDQLRKFRDREKLILGVCNGFQALLKAGLLLPHDPDEGPLATLTNNTHG